MGAEEVIQIGSEVFASKAVARQRVQALLHKYLPWQTVTDATDVEFLWFLLLLHPSASEKIGSGVSAFFVVPDAFGGRRFCVRRTDGSSDHFSYLKCLRQPTKKEEVSKAMRAEVVPWVVEFKRQIFGTNQWVACALTGVAVDWHSAHVDHYDPDFRVLRDDFLASEKIVFGQVLLIDVPEGGKALKDRALALRWYEFHAKRAQLRVVTQAANLARR